MNIDEPPKELSFGIWVGADNVLNPLIEDSFEVPTIMKLIEEMVTARHPNSPYFEVDYDREQKTEIRHCCIYEEDVECVNLTIWYQV